MRKLIVRFFLAICFFYGPFCLATATDSLSRLNPIKLATIPKIDDLKGGGYVILFRHTERNEAADKNFPEPIHFIDRRGECIDGTELTALGTQNAIKMGSTIRAKQIPVSEVFASPTCRTIQMAKLMFTNFTEKRELIYQDMRLPDEVESLKAQLRKLISEPPPAKTNLILIAHGNTLAFLGIDNKAKPGDATIIQPLTNNDFKYLGVIEAAEWRTVRGQSEK